MEALDASFSMSNGNPKKHQMASTFTPAYLPLFRSGELHRRVQDSLAGLKECRVCPRDCAVNRLEDKTAACHTGRYAQVAKRAWNHQF